MWASIRRVDTLSRIHSDFRLSLSIPEVSGYSGLVPPSRIPLGA
jgi:hypothetical protein